MRTSEVQQQFGANAAGYVTSVVHAKGASLERMVALVKPRPEWRVLDVATGAGHTALAFAPHVHSVVATDITSEMLPLASRLASDRGLENVSVEACDAEALIYPNRSFDLVTCRIAAHHFQDITRFVSEAARVLRPGGCLAVVDNVVPGSRLRGKRGEALRQAGNYVNAFEKLRDPSHHRCLTLEEWQDTIVDAGFEIEHQELMGKEMVFDSWAGRRQLTEKQRTRLKVMLKQAPREAAAFLTPDFGSDRITFRLAEVILIGRLR